MKYDISKASAHKIQTSAKVQKVSKSSSHRPQKHARTACSDGFSCFGGSLNGCGVHVFEPHILRLQSGTAPFLHY